MEPERIDKPDVLTRQILEGVRLFFEHRDRLEPISKPYGVGRFRKAPVQ